MCYSGEVRSSAEAREGEDIGADAESERAMSRLAGGLHRSRRGDVTFIIIIIIIIFLVIFVHF